MADPFIGEIRAVGFNYAPYDWAKCQGQIMQIQQNQALYSLLGILYGGDGRTTYALPNLSGRCAIGSGRSAVGTIRQEGQYGGSETNALGIVNIPTHNHGATVTGSISGKLNVFDGAADTGAPDKAMIARASVGGAELDFTYKGEPIDASKIKQLSDKSITTSGSGVNVTIGNTGAGAGFAIMPPYLVINYIIAVSGLYPQRP